MQILFVVMNMKKTNRIRIFFLFTALAVCIGYYAGYQYMTNSNEETAPPVADANPGQEVNDTELAVESANMTKSYTYLVLDDEGYLSVYMNDTDTLYMYTDIKTSELPAALQVEVREGKSFEQLEELYRFLESYSS